ncbi:MAG: penicillin-binding transpeptidase domain-containing protein [Kiritimatiellaeota bacterium]|nr:penicillin-binding transpeptidase domain-containing protein [Kiritimatiellota bacterium]
MTELLGLLGGGAGFAVLKVAFVVFFGVAVMMVVSAPSPSAGKVTYGLLRVGTAALLLAVLAYQATWQVGGFGNRAFVRFLRRYNKRPNAAQVQVVRAPILDRNGMVLAAPKRGEVWGRVYPLGEAAVHPVGYFHPRYGMTGVERLFDPVLSGYSDDESLMAKARGVFTPRADEGAPVTLNIDQRLQRKAYDLMAGQRGAVVVMRPQSGALLALVSSPGFDPNAPGPAAADGRALPAFNRAVQGRYPPGSTFKMLIAAAALTEGLSPAYDCPGGGYVARGSPPIRDSEYYAYQRNGKVWPGWGRLGMRGAMAHSSNVYFAQLGVAAGGAAFNRMMANARINEQLPYITAPDGSLRTARGNAPEVTKNATLAQLAIGQGEVLVTPLHMACFTAAIAADGTMPRPRLGKDEPPERLGTLCTPQVAAQIRPMLREVVTGGTGAKAEIAGLEVAGKTGTAQVPGAKDHAWFTCFAPAGRPNIVVTVLVENGGFGATAALPVAREVLKLADTLGYVRTAEGAGGSSECGVQSAECGVRSAELAGAVP